MLLAVVVVVVWKCNINKWNKFYRGFACTVKSNKLGLLKKSMQTDCLEKTK